MAKTIIQYTPYTDADPLHPLARHDGTDQLCPAAMYVQWSTGKVYFDYYFRSDGISFSEWHGHTDAFRVSPELSRDELNDLYQDAMPIIEEMVSHYKTRWDGSNNVADWGDFDYREKEENLYRLTDHGTSTGGVVFASDWFDIIYEEVKKAVIVEDFGTVADAGQLPALKIFFEDAAACESVTALGIDDLVDDIREFIQIED